MENLLVKLFLSIALTQIGISLSKTDKINLKTYIQRLGKASNQTLVIRWKPITVFQDEARKFQ